MVRIAVLSEQVSAQLRAAAAERPRELDNVQVVWSGTSGAELRRRGPVLRPQVLVADLALLGTGVGQDPRPELDALLNTTEADLALVLYSFTRRELVHQLSSTRSRAIKAPISLATLRLNMLSFLVKDTLRRSPAADSATLAEPSPPSEPEPLAAGASQTLHPVQQEPPLPHPTRLPLSDGSAQQLPAAGTPRLFTQTQLGRMQETLSSVRCECPNHLAELVSSLAAFEEYSRHCENADTADAKLHTHLYEQTSRARRLMEEALVALCRYERIEL